MRAAVYLRISSDPTGRQLGVTRQREDCLKLCAGKGWTPVEFVDNDVSASNGKKRPAYEKMLTAIRDGDIGAVACWDLDRLHRRPIELESFMALADEHHLALASVSGDIDLATAQGRLMARLKGSVAAHETEHKAARQRRAGRQRADAGKPAWSKAFGYLPGEHGPTPDPKTAPLVKQAYATVLAGGSLKDIAAAWNEAGALTGTGKQWTVTQVSNFLRKPRNAALRTYRADPHRPTRDDITGEGTWEAIVDPDLFWSVQALLSSRTSVKTVRKHAFSNVMRCGVCGDYLAGRQATLRGGRYGLVYGCKACHRVTIAAKHVEPMLHELVAGRLAKPDAIDLLKAEQHDAEESERLRAEANTLHTQLEQLGRDYAEGLVTGRQLKIATDVIEAKITANQRAQQDSERLRVFDGIPLGSDDVRQAVDNLSPDRFRAVLNTLCEIVIQPVGKGGKVFNPERVKVTWK